LEAQALALKAHAAAAGARLELLVETGSGSSVKARRTLQYALEELGAGRANALVVAKLDRLSRSTLDYLKMAEKAQREGWKLVVLDSPVDASTPHGRAMGTMQSVFSQLERELIAARTREALAAKKAQGARLGAPRNERAPLLAAEATTLREEGLTLQAIADQWNEHGIETLRGGSEWRPSGIAKLLKARVLDMQAEVARNAVVIFDPND
jgi:DNA invertase Pin-like site-specific DNA recombinase